MTDKNKRYFYVYKVVHPDTNEFYIGSRGSKCEPAYDVKYNGSMRTWKPDKSVLVKTILKSDFIDRDAAMAYEADLIATHIDNPLNRNYFHPSSKYHVSGRCNVKDKVGNILSVSVTDPRFLSGELISVQKGKVPVKDKEGKTSHVSVDDPRYLSGELVHCFTGLVAVKDKKGNQFNVHKDDPRYLSGEFKALVEGTSIVKDHTGRKFRVQSDDYRIATGELVGHTKDFISVRDKDGKYFTVHKNDPRYLNGEVVGATKGFIMVRDVNGNNLQISKTDPRFLSGELVSVNFGRVCAVNKFGRKFHVLSDDTRLITGELTKQGELSLRCKKFLENIKSYLDSKNKVIFIRKEVFFDLDHTTQKAFMTKLVKLKYVTKLKTKNGA